MTQLTETSFSNFSFKTGGEKIACDAKVNFEGG